MVYSLCVGGQVTVTIKIKTTKIETDSGQMIDRIKVDF